MMGGFLGIDPSEMCPEDTAGLHLYQEIVPVHPLVVSTLGPREFYSLIARTPASLPTLPAVCFAELQLGELADNPEYGRVGNLPYVNTDHLRQCWVDLGTKTVHTKLVDRISSASFPYRTLRMGLFLGNTERLMCFPMPSRGAAEQTLSLVALCGYVETAGVNIWVSVGVGSTDTL